MPVLSMRNIVAPSLLLAIAPAVFGQSYQQNNLTPDGFWHNRYHAILSMAAYGNYNVTCPANTFTEASKLRNFPDSERPPWEVVSEFGPTASGARGFTAIIPEMNKAAIIFTGNYELEANLDTTVTSWDAIGLGSQCPDCTVNAFAAQGYMEAKNLTNNFQAIRERYYNSGLVFTIAGHGLGGMHSQIASVDFNHQQIAYYSHAYGSPRVFNNAGAYYYNIRFNGEAGERGVANNDQYTESIPASENYAHAGTTFHYYGRNSSTGAPNWRICWNDVYDKEIVDDPACMPSATPGSTTTPLQDHYFYFTNVGQCGGNQAAVQSTTVINAFLSNPNGGYVDTDGYVDTNQTYTSSSAAYGARSTYTPRGSTAARQTARPSAPGGF